MEKYISFKLHDGYVPYFVKQFINAQSKSYRYYGISKDIERSYLPESVITYTREEMQNAIMEDVDIQKEDEEAIILMTTEEKRGYIENWLNKNKID